MADDDDFLDPEMRGLPEDPVEAFVIYERRLRGRTRSRLSGMSSLPREIELAREYANNLIVFIRSEGLNVPASFGIPSSSAMFWDWYNSFTTTVDQYIARVKFSRARRRTENIVTALSFTPDYQEEIGGLLDRIRKIVNQAELADDKKDAIYAKIAALQLEVERSKTLFGSLLSRFLDLTNAIGEGAEKLEPAVKVLERIMRVFGRAKADHDQGQLPPPEEKKQLPAPKNDGADLDDEIPF